MPRVNAFIWSVNAGAAVHAMSLNSVTGITPTAVSSASSSGRTFGVTGLLARERVSQVARPGVLGKMSWSAYPGAAGTVVLRFCNPRLASVTPPAGVYSFLAVH